MTFYRLLNNNKDYPAYAKQLHLFKFYVYIIKLIFHPPGPVHRQLVVEHECVADSADSSDDTAVCVRHRADSRQDAAHVLRLVDELETLIPDTRQAGAATLWRKWNNQLIFNGMLHGASTL